MINKLAINERNPKQIEQLLETWKTAVIATHSFLETNDIEEIEPEVITGLKNIPILYVYYAEETAKLIAFLGVAENKIEMFFVHNDYRNKGIGKALLQHSMQENNIEYVDVNEQNTGAVLFYKHMGFKEFAKSDIDEAGRPFPILHLEYVRG